MGRERGKGRGGEGKKKREEKREGTEKREGEGKREGTIGGASSPDNTKTSFYWFYC